MENEQEIRTWHQTFDFDSLMREARKHITALAGKVWSDHNASDPGITQLEVLAFCIADLSYRTSFDVKDILAGYKGDKQLPIDLPLADVALPNHPVTIKDFRKVLIDMKHPNPDGLNKLLIRNAFPVIWEDSEIPFFAVSQGGKETALMYREEVDELMKAEGIPNSDTVVIEPGSGDPTDSSAAAKEINISEKIVLNGLYNLQIEFEDDLEKLPLYLKNLNQNYFEDEVSVRGQQFTVSVLLPYWDEIRWTLKDADLSPGKIEYKLREEDDEDYFIAVDKLSYDDYFYDYYAELEIDGHGITAYIKTKTRIESSVTVQGNQFNFSVNFLDWNELSNGVKRDYSLGGTNNLQQLFVDTDDTELLEVTDVSIDKSQLIYDLQSRFSFDILKDDGTTRTKIVNLLTRIEFEEKTVIGQNQFDGVKDAIKNQFQDLLDTKIELEAAIFEMMTKGNSELYTAYQAKLNEVFDYLYGDNGVWSYLGKFRNECEDFARFTASRIQEVALFGKLIVSPNYNSSELLSEIYFRVDQFLNPLVKFHSLSEMTDKGYQFHELFNGPLLTHGFIEDQDLNNLKRRSVVYTSDLIRIIMDVDGVEAVEDFNISSYIDNRLMGRNVINCLSLTNSEIYKPRFSAEKTGLKVYVSGEQESVIDEDVVKLYEGKLGFQKSEQISDADGVQLQLPLGDDQEIEKYYSIQHDFPELYGIGEYGLPIDATEERKARAKQLKAFLLPMEQLLANYLKQVAHLPELFSYNRSINETYAFQPLYEVPDVQPLFEGFVQSNDTWETFKQDLSNSYQMAMQEGESKDEFRSRRNRFLDHLLGRFGETFEAYATQMFDRHKDLLNDPLEIESYLNERNETLVRLISDKISFAEDYPKVSGERYGAFDTTLDSSKYIDNIASYKRRICRLLGIEAIDNQFLFGAEMDEEKNEIDIEGMHLVEHILLRPLVPNDEFLNIVNRVNEEGNNFVYDADLDPYSFKLTIVLPKNAGRFKNPAFRAFVERLIRYETPAHIVIYFRWMDASFGKQFEEIYSKWKKNVSDIKPYFFQKVGELSRAELIDYLQTMLTSEGSDVKLFLESDSKALMEKRAYTKGYAGKGNLTALEEVTEGLSITKRPTIFTVRNELIRLLNRSEKLELKLYDKDQKLLHDTDGSVQFEEGAGDVFSMFVSEIGGTITIYKMDDDTSEWMSLDTWKPIDQNWFGTDHYLGDSESGLTEKFGGPGRYMVNYDVAEEDLSSAWKIIEVTPVPVPVSMRIGNDAELLSFDTENDGVFSLKNNAWQDHFLQLSPYDELNGRVMIFSNNGLEPVELVNPESGNENIPLEHIYTQFGAGMYHITYALNGQSTFADIELAVELSIEVRGESTEYTPSELNTIDVPTNETMLTITFDLPEGTLRVFDLDKDFSTKRRESVVLETPLAVEVSSGATRGAALSNQLLYRENIRELIIDRSTDTDWQEGHRYHFYYEFGGQFTDVIVVFEKAIPEAPWLKIYKDGEEMIELPYPLSTDNRETLYEMVFHPKGAMVTRFVEIDGTERELDTFTVSDDQFRERLNVEELYAQYGGGPYKTVISSEGGEASLLFNLTNEGTDVPGNNLDPTFTFSKVRKKGDKYTVVGEPLLPEARAYVWRRNDNVISRRRNPGITLNFSKKEMIVVTLTMHEGEFEATFGLNVTKEMLDSLMEDQ